MGGVSRRKEVGRLHQRAATVLGARQRAKAQEGGERSLQEENEEDPSKE